MAMPAITIMKPQLPDPDPSEGRHVVERAPRRIDAGRARLPAEPDPAAPVRAAPILELVLTPIKTRPGHYAISLDGRCLVRSREPFFSAARVLEAEGVPPDTILTTRHAGSTVTATRSTVGEAAKWTIEESDDRGLRLRKWRPYPMAAQGGVGERENARSDPVGTNAAGADHIAFSAAPTPSAGDIATLQHRAA